MPLKKAVNREHWELESKQKSLLVRGLDCISKYTSQKNREEPTGEIREQRKKAQRERKRELGSSNMGVLIPQKDRELPMMHYLCKDSILMFSFAV